MVSVHSEKIDFDEIERQGLRAIDRDARYWRENDAKFRAVNQKVASYEEFRDIVLASHLKPLDKKEKIDFVGPIKSSCWNTLASKPGVEVSPNTVTLADGTRFQLPENVAEFCKLWRHINKIEDRYDFLSIFPPNFMGELFKTEIPAGILMELIEVFKYSLSLDNKETNCFTALQAIDVMKQLSNSSRFELNLMFLTSNEKAAVKSLFDDIAKSIDKADCDVVLLLENLGKIYSVQ